jgi:hypothetical protein
MPRAHNKPIHADDLSRQIDEALPQEEEKLDKDGNKKKEPNWPVLYVIIAIAVFGLGLLVISLMNLAFDGYMHI